jgi:hypothetical protein
MKRINKIVTFLTVFMFLQIFVGVLISIAVYQPLTEEYMHIALVEEPPTLLQCFTENPYFTVPLISFVALFIIRKIIITNNKKENNHEPDSVSKSARQGNPGR